MNNKKRRTLQLVYDLFYGSGGVWPSVGRVQQVLDHQGGCAIDVSRVVRRMPTRVMRPLHDSGGYIPASAELVLTAEGVARCTGSQEDITNLVIAVKWLARRMKHAALSGAPDLYGAYFTISQLAAAVSLEPDRTAVNRLAAILQAEGWIQHGNGTHSKRRASLLRTPRSRSIP